LARTGIHWIVALNFGCWPRLEVRDYLTSDFGPKGSIGTSAYFFRA
jgi:hypothetical protein